MKRNILILFSLALLPACLGGGGGNGGGGNNCAPAAFFVAGTWNSSFLCQDDNPSFGCFNGGDVLTVTQDGDDTAPGNNVSFTDNNGGSFTGLLCGTTFLWNGTAPGITEGGTWEFSDAEHFSKDTSYNRNDGTGGGTCTGDGVKDPLPSPPLPACP